MSTTMTRVCTLLPSVRRMFVSGDKGWICVHYMEALRFINDCFVKQYIDSGQTSILKVPTEKYGSNGKVR